MELTKFQYLLLGFTINAPLYRDTFAAVKDSKPTLGECTLFNDLNINKPKGLTMHKYSGEIVEMEITKTTSTYSRKEDFSEKFDHTKMMGGVSISLFGLVSASAEAKKTSSIKRNTKSLVIYRHQRIHRGVSSLATVQVGKNWETCTKIDKHYYLRDILTGMESYLFVNLHFNSESKREELEVKIKVKILFFSISKTIREVKTSFDQDIKITVDYMSSFPNEKESKDHVSVDDALTHIEKLESKMDANKQAIRAESIDNLIKDKNSHLTYFFMPCMIQTSIAALGFEPKKNTILFEFIERVTEMRSVEQDLSTLHARGVKATKLTQLKNDIDQRLVAIDTTEKINEFSRGDTAEKLRNFYGPKRAPYYYERKMNNIIQTME
jgi:hypothetical protein